MSGACNKGFFYMLFLLWRILFLVKLQAYSLRLYSNTNFFTGVFQGFSLLLWNTYLKEHLWVATSVHFSREVSQKEYTFPRKTLSRGLFKCENATLETILGGLIISWSIYLLVHEYWGCYFPVNIIGEYFFRGILICGYAGVKTTYFVLHSLSYFSSKIWDIIPDEIKNSWSFDEFEITIRKWVFSNCHWKLCRSYIQHEGCFNMK